MRTSPNNRAASPAVIRTRAMADAIAATAREKGTVTRRDLAAQGFSPAEIDRLGEQALALSRSENEGRPRLAPGREG